MVAEVENDGGNGELTLPDGPAENSTSTLATIGGGNDDHLHHHGGNAVSLRLRRSSSDLGDVANASGLRLVSPGVWSDERTATHEKEAKDPVEASDFHVKREGEDEGKDEGEDEGESETESEAEEPCSLALALALALALGVPWPCPCSVILFYSILL